MDCIIVHNTPTNTMRLLRYWIELALVEIGHAVFVLELDPLKLKTQLILIRYDVFLLLCQVR